MCYKQFIATQLRVIEIFFEAFERAIDSYFLCNIINSTQRKCGLGSHCKRTVPTTFRFQNGCFGTNDLHTDFLLSPLHILLKSRAFVIITMGLFFPAFGVEQAHFSPLTTCLTACGDFWLIIGRFLTILKSIFTFCVL